MDSETIRGALGLLQQDPESSDAWGTLASALDGASGQADEELSSLLASARHAHSERGEWDAVAALLAVEIERQSDDQQKTMLLMELGRVRQQELLDEAGALEAFRRVVDIVADDELAQAALAESAERAGHWEELARAYLQESETAPDEVYKASMLMRVAEVEWRFAGSKLDEQRVLGFLAQATEADPKNQSVLQMLERIYRKTEDYKALSEVLARWVRYGTEASPRIAAALRLARLQKNRLENPDAAAAAYELALTVDASQAEAMESLVEHYSEKQNWDKLVVLYERELGQIDAQRGDRVGDMLQIAMLHYKKRQNLADAAQWFERVRRVEPTNGAMLQFFRDYSQQIGDEALLLQVLQDAQRVFAEGSEKRAITQEIAQLAEGQQDAQKAIDQYKALLRQDPGNAEALAALNSLYRKTQGYTQLVDLLRHQLDRLGEDQPDERLALLREVAAIYRENTPNDTSLVSVLNQILQVQPEHAAAVRELISLYERLARPRDLLLNQQRLAAITDDPEEKAELFRASGRRWLEQFSNVQNATHAFEQLLLVSPHDREARDTLSELYKKRRAWSELYTLYDNELPSIEGPRRIAVMKEMAQLAAERLGKGDVASKLYLDILEAEPNNLAVLDALEKQAERARDWDLVAKALERRLTVAADPAGQVLILQKLGPVYSDQLKNAEAATGAWRRILEIEPGHARAVRVLRDTYLQDAAFDALEELYAGQADFEGLAEVLSNAADRSDAIRTKIELSYRAAAVFEKRLGTPDRAFRSYERILAADPMDANAARALVPLYEDDEKWARLPPLYELLLSESTDDSEKLRLYKKLVDISTRRLSDRSAAVRFARKAYEIAPEDPDVLEMFESACREANSWESYVEALEARLKLHRESQPPAATESEEAGKGKKRKKSRSKSEPAPAEGALQRTTVGRLEVKLAQVYDEQLGRTADAVTTYKRLLSVQPDDAVAGNALEALLRRDGSRDDLRWLLGLRVEHAPDQGRRISQLNEWASLEETVFEDPARGAELYRRIVELSPTDEEALRNLARLLMTLGDPAAAVEVLEQHRDLSQSPERRAQLEAELAEAYLHRLENHDAALAAAVRVVELGAELSRAVEVLQRLLEVPSTKAKAAKILAAVYHAGNESRHEADALGVLLSVEADPSARLELYGRAADVHECLASYGAAFELMVRACREFPSELSLWEKAAVLSAQAGRPAELAEAYRDVLRGELPEDIQRALCERAAALHEDQLGDPVGATPYLEKVLAFDPSNHAAFSKLKQILTSAQRWHELQALYDKTAAAIDDPSAKTEILGEVAMICEEFMDDSLTALGYYERMLEVEPGQENAQEALDRLYAKHEKFDKLSQLLDQRLETSSGDRAVQYRLRLATLFLDKLHQPVNALRHVEDVLTDDLSNAKARELCERIIEIGSLRGAAAAVLERVYEARDDVRELVRVLEVRLDVLRASTEAEGRGEERLLLKRIADLKNERLRDDEGALAALADYVPLEPSDIDARSDLLGICNRLGVYERVAVVLETAAKAANTPELTGEIFGQAAKMWRGPLNDASKAENLYRQVLELDPENVDMVLPAAQALEEIYLASGAFIELTKVLRIELKLETDPDVAGRLLGRIAELCESKLDDPEGAIAAWKLRLDQDPGDDQALESLDRLYVRGEHWRSLVEILEARRDRAQDPSARARVMLRIADVYATKLEDETSAIDAYRALNEQFEPSLPTLTALAGLFEKGQRWDELVETYEAQLDLAESVADRLSLQSTIGDVRRMHLSSPALALESYKAVVSVDPSHGRARAALEEMLTSEDAAIRREAAETLLPIYDGEGNNERLLAVFETLTDCLDDPVQRLELLSRAIEVAGTSLGDSGRALSYAARAVREAAGHVDLVPWLESLERLSATTGKRVEQVELLREVLGEIFDGEVQFSVTLRIATLARDELGDNELALQYFRNALDVRPDAPAALSALESLYAAAGDHQNLLEVLERRAETSSDDHQRKELLCRRGALLDAKLKEPGRAIAVYESILDIDLDPRAINALVELYSAEKRWTDLISLYQRKLEGGSSSAADLRVMIAQVAFERLHDPFRAFEELQAALRSEAQHEGAVAALEKLMSEPGDAEQHSQAATLLEPIYLSRADYDRVMRTIEARLEYADEPGERRDLLERLAQLYEEQKEDYTSALETVARILHEDLGEESTISELERLAKVGDNRGRLAEIYAGELADVETDDAVSAKLCERTGELYRSLGDKQKALSFFRRALALDRENRTLFKAVDSLLEELGDGEARIALHQQALESRFEQADRLRLLHTVAKLQNEGLGHKSDAIATYVEILDLEPSDSVALDTLGRLYYETARFEELYDLVLRLAEGAQDGRAVVAYRLELAKLCRNELKDVSRAIDQLEEVVQASPGEVRAIEELEKLRSDPQYKRRVVEVLSPIYEKADAWRHLIKLNEDRFQLADSNAERVQVLRETATLWERRGGDPTKARQGLAAAVRLDPEDEDVRLEFERLTELTGASDPHAWDGLAQLYTSVLEKDPELASARELWAKLAKTHDGPRDDPRSALQAYDRLHELEPNELAPVERMEALSILLSDWETLDRVLVVRAELVADDEERASIWRRVGEGRRDMLNNAPGAIEAYERALEFEPDSAFTVDCLTDLYEQQNNAQRLVELYQRRVELTDDDDNEQRYNLLLLVAERLEKDFDDRIGAIDALRHALTNVPSDPVVLGRLNGLYRAVEQWPELLENLREQADGSGDAALRAELRFGMGQLLADKLESYDEALDCYRLALEEVPGHEGARAASRTIGEQHEELRETVAKVLIPALTQCSAFEDLVGILEMRLTVESDPLVRSATLRATADVLQHQLKDLRRTLSALLRAIAEIPEDAELHGEVTQLCTKLGDFRGYADALGERAQNTFDAELAKDLLSRLGRICEVQLSDVPRAIDAYRKAVEQVGDQTELLEALDRLYELSEDWTHLAEILERRAVLNESDEARAALFYRLATLQLEKFAEPGQALGSLRSALELNTFHDESVAQLESLTDRSDLFDEASEVLETVYRSRGTTEKLAGLFQKRVRFARSTPDRIEMRRDLARVLEQELGDPLGAQQVLQQGLGDDPSDDAQLDELERLAGITGDWASAAAALEKSIDEASVLGPDVGKTLAVRLAHWFRDRAFKPEESERAFERALSFEPNSDQVLVELEALQMSPGREMARVETLLRRARLQYDEQQREELYRAAKNLAEGQGANERVEAVVRELLKHDDGNSWALRELCALREAAGDHEETLGLLIRLTDVALDANEGSSLRHRAASVARAHLNDLTKAVELYAQLFEDDPFDAAAAVALRQLYTELNQPEQLVRLLERLVDIADEPRQRSEIRLELARLNQEKFQATDTAIEQLRIILVEDPEFSDAVVLLSRLYEDAGRDEELAELIHDQIAAAEERGDSESQLRFEVRLGEVYEGKLADKPRAIETYERVLVRDPNHVEALQALARLHRSQDQHLAAAEIFERLIELVEPEGQLPLLKDVASAYQSAGDFERACGALERVLGRSPADAEVRETLRSLYRDITAWEKLGNLVAEDALSESDEAKKVQLLREAATIFSEQQKDYVRAAELLERATALKPGERQLLTQLCDAYSASGRADEAVRVLEQIVESYGGRRSKELGDIHRRLATAFQLSGKVERAAEELDKAFRIEPGNVDVLRALGDLSLGLNDLKRAQQMFRALLLQKLDSESPISKAEVFYYLGVIHQRLGEKSKAIQMLERAIQTDAELEIAKSLLATIKG